MRSFFSVDNIKSFHVHSLPSDSLRMFITLWPFSSKQLPDSRVILLLVASPKRYGPYVYVTSEAVQGNASLILSHKDADGL